ncbi:MAG TPA: phosphatidylinositol-specific phospholipase C1-like protein [Acidobacteriaceae bacterium]|nr:phosphatidylinositol-specific phospholipase C1-like protein [Acidobacteriaceae bacterium]
MFRHAGFQAAAGAALAASVTVAAAAQQITQAQQDQKVHVNQIQVIGSHNSYHAGFAPSERKLLEAHHPKALRSLDYKHAPLADQLSSGVRQIEIDIFNDPDGGKFAHPAIVNMVAAAHLPADPDFDPDHEMEKPGFKVMHVQDLDERATCHTFVKCLTQVRDWSKQQPGHLPIFILVETKEGVPSEMPNAPKGDVFTPQIFDAVDAEIRSVFRPDEMITPDQVRGNSASLNEAIRTHGWPTLAQARGKVIFLLDQAHAAPVYAQGHSSLRGRLIFTNSEPGLPEAAFVEQNDGTKEAIDALVKQGYLVRTRTDEGTEQARTNDRTRLDRALSSGAQMLSTDYPPAEPSQWTSFVVKLPGDLVARCNPVNKPAGCMDSLLEPAGNK